MRRPAGHRIRRPAEGSSRRVDPPAPANTPVEGNPGGGVPGLEGLAREILNESGGPALPPTPQAPQWQGPTEGGLPMGAREPLSVPHVHGQPLPHPPNVHASDHRGDAEVLADRVLAVGSAGARRHQIPRSRSRRRRSRTRSSSSSHSNSHGRAGSTGLSRLQHTAERRPGKLTRQGLEAMGRHLAPRYGGDRGVNVRAGVDLEPIAQVYLTNVLLPSRPPGMNLCNERELRTLAEVLDHILRGDLLRAANIAIQRFKAVEAASSSEGSWEIAQRLELIPPTAISTTSVAEREAAMKAELRERGGSLAPCGPAMPKATSHPELAKGKGSSSQ